MNNDLISREVLKDAIMQEVYKDRVGVFVARRIFKLIDNAPTVHHPNCDNCEDKAMQYSLGFQDGYMTGKERSQVIDNCDMNVFEPEKYMRGGAE